MSSTPPPATRVDLSGATIGEYELLRRLGQGGMAAVYLANQKSLQRQVAMKILRPELASDPAYVARFVDEAQAAAQLVHPHIVQIFEIGQQDQQHFIVQEYVRGSNLKQVLQQHGPLSPQAVVSVLRQVALALHKAAEHGVIHRDIKPENLLLGPNGVIKVADFGLARAAIDGESVRRTQAGLILGTPLYMSPEQIEDRPLDQRSDLYSLGVTCCHLLAGRPPFTGETPLALAYQHVRTAAPSVKSLRPDAPDGLCRLLDRLMEKEPSRRPQSAPEVVKQLKAQCPELIDNDDEEQWAHHELLALSESQTSASQQLSLAMRFESRRRWQRLWGGVALIVALLAIVPIGAGLAYWLRPPRLLRQAEAEIAFTRRLDSIEQQYNHAAVVGTPEALEAVWKLHQGADSRDEFIIRKAKRRLALLHASDGHPELAAPLFDELAQVEETAAEFRVFGMLGQALLLWSNDQQDQAALRINAALESLGKLTFPERNIALQLFETEMRRRVQELLREHQARGAD